MPELGSAGSRFTGHPAAAVGETLRLLPAELLTGGTDRAGGLLLAVGIVVLWRRAAGRTPVCRHHAVLAVALLGAACFSVTTALLHYGAACCERHQATRFWFGDLLAILLVLAAGPLFGRWRALASPWVAASCLAAALLLPLQARLPGLRTDYGALDLARSGRDRTWASGHAPHRADMAFYLPPDGAEMQVRGTWQPERHFVIDPGAPVMLRAMAEFFGKAAITVCQPYQTDNPWLMHGRRIEACPHALRPLIVVP